jgi:hypothetical protein
MNEKLLKVEVRLRYQEDGLSWEVRPVVTTFEVRRAGLVYVVDLEGGYKITITTAAKAIAIEEDAIEVRWNFQGSNQGHYHFV